MKRPRRQPCSEIQEYGLAGSRLDSITSSISVASASAPRSQRGSRSSKTSASEPVSRAKRPPSDSQLKALSSGNCISATTALSSSALASKAARMRSIGACLRMAIEANSPVPTQPHPVTSDSSNCCPCTSSGRNRLMFSIRSGSPGNTPCNHCTGQESGSVSHSRTIAPMPNR